MSFYKEILPFVEYIHSIRRLEAYLSFDMKFPVKWSIPKSIVDEGKIIGFEVEDQNSKGITFVTPINELEVSTILVKIGKIIKLNKERELKERALKEKELEEKERKLKEKERKLKEKEKEIKERLFKQTVEQLKQTFEKTDLDKLQNLYFDFEDEDVDTELDGELDNDFEDELSINQRIKLGDEQDRQESTTTELV